MEWGVRREGQRGDRKGDGIEIRLRVRERGHVKHCREWRRTEIDRRGG